MTVLQVNQTLCQTHQCILHSRAHRLQAFSGVLHLLLDLWQQSFELLQLLPLLWQSLWTFGFVKHLLQLVWNCINYILIIALMILWKQISLQEPMLTKPVLYDRDGALQRLDGLAVLRVQAIGHTELVVSLCQQAAVWVQVLHLQLQALLEILQCLWIVPWKREAANQYLTCKKQTLHSQSFIHCSGSAGMDTAMSWEQYRLHQLKIWSLSGDATEKNLFCNYRVWMRASTQKTSISKSWSWDILWFN